MDIYSQVSVSIPSVSQRFGFTSGVCTRAAIARFLVPLTPTLSHRVGPEEYSHGGRALGFPPHQTRCSGVRISVLCFRICVAILVPARRLFTPTPISEVWLNLTGTYKSWKTRFPSFFDGRSPHRRAPDPMFWCSIGVCASRLARDAHSRVIRINPYIPDMAFDLRSLRQELK